jgi:hypothetical protein
MRSETASRARADTDIGPLDAAGLQRGEKGRAAPDAIMIATAATPARCDRCLVVVVVVVLCC